MMPEEILREKQFKKWRHTWKRELIERDNPQWQDLYDDVARSRCPGFHLSASLRPE